MMPFSLSRWLLLCILSGKEASGLVITWLILARVRWALLCTAVAREYGAGVVTTVHVSRDKLGLRVRSFLMGVSRSKLLSRTRRSS